MDWTTLTGELNLEALSEQIEQLFPNFSIDFSSLLGQILSGNHPTIQVIFHSTATFQFINR